MSDFPIQLVFIWLFLVLGIVIASRKAAKKMQQKNGAARSAPTVTRRNAHGDDCAYGEANHEYSHQDDRRLQQLQGYLKAGLIDQKEYREMVARYRRQSKYDDN